MKIGIDVRLWNETGVGRYIRNLITELAILDSHNEYVLFALKSDKEAITQTVKTRLHKWQIVTKDIRWHSLSEQTEFIHLLYKQKLDLMHFPYFSLPVLYKRPFVVTIHDLIIHHFDTGKASTLSLPLYKTKRYFFSRVLRHGLNASKQIIVPLECVKEDIIKTFKLPPSKIVVTKEGYDSGISNNKYQITNNKKELEIGDWRFDIGNYFLYVGNAYPHKNLEKLIEGFKSFKKTHRSEMQLLMVGKSDYFYSHLEEQYKNEKDIVFLHDVSDAQLGSLYRKASAFISASLMEGFGLPPLEAMANDTVPLLSNIPSFREVCEESAIYFDQTNPSDITRAMIEWVSTDEKKKKQMVVKGRETVKKYSWKHMAEETLKVYESATN